jgi:hypothetical protein
LSGVTLNSYLGSCWAIAHGEQWNGKAMRATGADRIIACPLAHCDTIDSNATLNTSNGSALTSHRNKGFNGVPASISNGEYPTTRIHNTNIWLIDGIPYNPAKPLDPSGLCKMLSIIGVEMPMC